MKNSKSTFGTTAQCFFFPDSLSAQNMVRVIEGKLIWKFDWKTKITSSQREVRVTEGKITVNVWWKSRGNRFWLEFAWGSSLARVRVMGSLRFKKSKLGQMKTLLYWLHMKILVLEECVTKFSQNQPLSMRSAHISNRLKHWSIGNTKEGTVKKKWRRLNRIAIRRFENCLA